MSGSWTITTPRIAKVAGMPPHGNNAISTVSNAHINRCGALFTLVDSDPSVRKEPLGECRVDVCNAERHSADINTHFQPDLDLVE